MIVRSSAMFGILAAALLSLGCSPDCNALCEEGNGCEGVGAEPGWSAFGVNKQDCGAVCGAAETLNGKGYCEDQFTDYLECLGRRDDLCTTGPSVCDRRFDDYRNCVAGYCLSTQGDKGIDPTPVDQTDKDCQTLGL